MMFKWKKGNKLIFFSLLSSLLFCNYSLAQTSKPTTFKNGIQGNSNIFDSDGNNLGNLSALISTANNAIPKSQIGVANGVAPLDSNSMMSSAVNGNINSATTSKSTDYYTTVTIDFCQKGQWIPNPTGLKLSVGDTLQLGDGYGGFASQVKVTGVDTIGSITTYDLILNGQQSIPYLNITANATPISVANSDATMPCFIDTSNNKTTLSNSYNFMDKFSGKIYLEDYGIKMDNTDSDNAKLQLLYNSLSNGTEVVVPPNSNWDGQSLNLIDPNKHILWNYNGNSVGGWYPPPPGDGDTTLLTNSGNIYLEKRDMNTKNFVPPLDLLYWNADENYCGAWGKCWSQYAPLHLHTIVGPTSSGNSSSIAATFDSYGQAPSGSYDVGFSLNMNKYGQNSQWGVVVDMVDFSAKSPGAFADWNEWDIWTYGQDVKEWDPSFYKMHSGSRSLMYFNGHGLSKPSWTASQNISKGIDKGLADQADLTQPVVISSTGTDNIDYVWYAATGGTTGTTKPTFPTPAKFIGQISNGVMTVTSVYSGTIQVNDYVTGAMPVWPVKITGQTSGTTGGVGVYTVSGTDGTADNQPMYSAARVIDGTVTWQFGEEYASTIGSALFLSADQIDYGMVYDTGTIIGGAAVDTSVAKMGNTAAVIRMAPDQVIDFSSLNDKASRNLRTLSYSSSDQKLEFNQNGKTTFAIADDGTISVNNVYGPARVVTSRNNSVNNFSFDGNNGIIHAYIDTTLVGTITKYDSAAPTSATSNCTVGEVFDDITYHYSCIATNTWRRVAWDTTFN